MLCRPPNIPFHLFKLFVQIVFWPKSRLQTEDRVETVALKFPPMLLTCIVSRIRDFCRKIGWGEKWKSLRFFRKTWQNFFLRIFCTFLSHDGNTGSRYRSFHSPKFSPNLGKNYVSSEILWLDWTYIGNLSKLSGLIWHWIDNQSSFHFHQKVFSL